MFFDVAHRYINHWRRMYHSYDAYGKVDISRDVPTNHTTEPLATTKKSGGVRQTNKYSEHSGHV